MSNNSDKFDYFGWDEDPIGKYKQPKPNNAYTKGQGYPIDEMDLTGTKSKGRWIKPLYGNKKNRVEIKGCKNTSRGKKFYLDDEQIADPPDTKGS